MRKDVILGMSIGGVMIAVVIVYLTVAMPKAPKSGVALDTGGTTLDGPAGGDTPDGVDGHDGRGSDAPHELIHGTGDAPAKPPLVARADGRSTAGRSTGGRSTPPASASPPRSDWTVLLTTGQVSTAASTGATDRSAAETADGNAGASPASPAPSGAATGGASPALAGPSDAATGGASSANPLSGAATGGAATLAPVTPIIGASASGASPVMMAGGPAETSGAGDSDTGPLASGARPLIPDAAPTPLASGARPLIPDAAPTPAGPSAVAPSAPDRPARSTYLDGRTPIAHTAVSPTTHPGARIHRIQKNETFSTIAAAAYGSASFYPYILRANPGVDPTKLKINQEILLPDLSEVRPQAAHESDAQGASAVVPPSTPSTPPPLRVIDAATEYTVVVGDSLHKIAMKLYGNTNNVDALYEQNRDVIGPDPAKLKVGMVLKKLTAKTEGGGSAGDR